MYMLTSVHGIIPFVRMLMAYLTKKTFVTENYSIFREAQHNKVGQQIYLKNSPEWTLIL